MPCALLLLLLSLGHDLAAKKEKNRTVRMRDENKKSVLQKPREIVLSTPEEKKTLGARHASYSARIELKPRPQVPDGLPVST